MNHTQIGGNRYMYDNMSEAYPDPIHPELYPYYQNMKEAVGLLADAPDSNKLFYTDMVKRSLSDLRIAENVLTDVGLRKKSLFFILCRLLHICKKFR